MPVMNTLMVSALLILISSSVSVGATVHGPIGPFRRGPRITRLRAFVQTVREKTNSTVEISQFPLGGSPPQPGVTGYASVFNTKVTRDFAYTSPEIGRYQGTLFQTSSTDFYTSGNVLIYGKGNFTVQGMLFLVPITGGTDEYNLAQGNVTFTILSRYGQNQVASLDAIILTPQ